MLLISGGLGASRGNGTLTSQGSPQRHAVAGRGLKTGRPPRAVAAAVAAGVAAEPPAEPAPLAAPRRAPRASAPSSRLRELHALLNDGLVTEEEYGTKRAEIVAAL